MNFPKINKDELKYKVKCALNNIKYKAGYTFNTYADFSLSIPLFFTEKTYQLAGFVENGIIGKRKFTDWNSVKEYTPGYASRQKLRDKWDTQKGVELISSQLVGMAAFFAAGPIVADTVYNGLEKFIDQDSQLTRQLTTSLATIIAGYTAGNGTVLLDYTLFRNRKDHLKEDGTLDKKKIYKSAKKLILGAAAFDAPFFGGKFFVQTEMIRKGIDPANASMIFDSVGVAAWYTYLIPAYLSNGTIKPNKRIEDKR